jgi:hypothetical protein
MGFHCHLSSSVSFTEYQSIQGLIPVLRIIITIVLSGKDGKRRKYGVVQSFWVQKAHLNSNMMLMIIRATSFLGTRHCRYYFL